MSQREQVKITLSTEAREKLDGDRGELKRSDWIEKLILDSDGIAWENIGTQIGSTAAEGALTTIDAIRAAWESGTFRKINGFMWADVDDADQLARAQICWVEDDRDSPPSVLPYRGANNENPELADVEPLTLDQLWAWVDSYRLDD